MTGDIIQFATHRELKKFHCDRPAPRGSAAAVRPANIVDWRVARISRLLSELEELMRVTNDVPPPILGQARNGLAKARQVVGSSTAAADLRGAPQPELDDERIERMYRELNQHA